MKNASTDPAQQNVSAFFDALRPIEGGYQADIFAFVAVKHLGVFTLVQASLFRNTSIDLEKSSFETSDVLAGRFNISEVNMSSEEFIRRALLGSISTPFGELRFPSGEAGRYATNFEPFHEDGLAIQQRLNVLRLDGAIVDGYLDVVALGWHLRAALEPYHGLEDVLHSLQLGSLRGNLNISVIAFQVALIDTDSYISGNEAFLKVRLANSLDNKGFRLGYRVLHQGKVFARTSLCGEELNWEESEKFKIGNVKIEVPSSSVIQCFASYSGVAQHFFWIVDPTTSQNPRRTAFEVFDLELVLLREFLSKQGRGQNARDLEIGVSWLLWLLGLSTATLGGTAKTQDFADLIATTPEGHFFVVECTTGLLKADNKLPMLIQRAQLVKERIVLSGNRHLKVIPVMVTSRTREEIRADLDQAERLGVLVITKEVIEEVLTRTITIPNADSLFIEAERAVHENLSKYHLEQ